MTMIDKEARAERRRRQEEGARRLRESGVLDDLFAKIDAGEVQLDGRDGLIQQLIKTGLERGLHAELTDHVGYERGDPEAAAIVFAADIPTVVVPWEPCTTHYLTGAETDALFATVPDGQHKEFALALASHSRQTPAGHRNLGSMCFVDPLAAAVVVEPGIVTRSLRASVDVALAPGITRGMTVVDPSGRLGTPMVTLVEAVDVDRLAALYAASVGGR